MLAEEPVLEPLSTQLMQLKKCVISYAGDNTSQRVFQAMEGLSNFDFYPHMPKSVSSSKWKVEDTNDTDNVALVKSADLKEFFKNMLKSEVIEYTKKISKYNTDMQPLYGIILRNLDINARTLIKSNTTFTSIHKDKDQIDLIKLLRKMCHKEEDVIYPPKTLYYSLRDFVTCKQEGIEKLIDCMKTLKLKMNMMTSSQDEVNWISTPNKDLMVVMHPEIQWSKKTYDECTPNEMSKLDILVKDRFIAFCDIEISYVRHHGGISLKTFVDNQAAAHKNAHTCCPNGTTALVFLVSQIEEAHPSQKKKHHKRSQNVPPGQSISPKKRNGVEFTQTESENRQAVFQLLMAGYSNHDDSTLCGIPHLLRTL